MDEVYYQNTNNEDCPIKCNVVSNQLNFVNSINYRNRGDLNNSFKGVSEPLPKEPLHYSSHKHSDESSLSGRLDKDEEDIKNIL